MSALEMLDGLTVHHFSDGLYAKEMHIPAGMAVLKHTHDYDHLSVLAKGKVVVLRGEEMEIIEGPACLDIEAGLIHGVKAITDCVWFCIHATDEKDSSKVDEVLIKGD
jgi:quercetin dioxygenase-like cupin family protein